MDSRIRKTVLDFWLSDGGKQAINIIEEHISSELAFHIEHLLLRSINRLWPYLHHPIVAEFLQSKERSGILDVLDVGCGDGWEALSLGALLYPARVLGIGNEPWWEDPERESLRTTLPQMLKQSKNALSYFEEGHPVAERLTELRSLLEVVESSNLTLSLHDIDSSAWPDNTPRFEIVFSKFSFYHARDHEQALKTIRDRMAPGSLYILDEPSDPIDSFPGLPPEWFREVAIERLGFTSYVSLDVGYRPISLLWR